MILYGKTWRKTMDATLERLIPRKYCRQTINRIHTVSDLQRFIKLMTKGVGKSYSPLSTLVTAGNHKLPKKTGIFNMGPARDCPSFKLGFCQAIVNGKRVCYALKSENDYRPGVYSHRLAQKNYWLSVTPEKFVIDFVTMNTLKTLPFNALRFNESGDFWSQECVEKAEEIARMLHKFDIVTYSYSARRDLDYSHCKRLIISGSGFKKEGIKNIFTMVTDLKDRPKGYGICKGNCRVCTRCLKSGLNTVVKYH
jgi:hypothetical protein